MGGIDYQINVYANRFSDKDFFVLGYYKKLWRAKLAAWWYVNFRMSNPFGKNRGEVRIYIRNQK
jgi:hypothetical protein